MADKTIIFVHGWSVTNTDTYGGLPTALRRYLAQRDDTAEIRHLFLGAYVSFVDTVTLTDISRAFEAALRREAGDAIAAGREIVCITHSTGGPVVRDWMHRFYTSQNRACPMTHLIMLAPANFGSALAVLGQRTVGRLKAWMSGIEPGQRVLDWLQLGSRENLELNRSTLAQGPAHEWAEPVYCFVLTGQCINHALYDHVNSYTGELGSDGVVRVAAANQNATFLRLEQERPTIEQGEAVKSALKLAADGVLQEDSYAFRLIEGRSHSGDKMGIMTSVRDEDGPDDHPVLTPLLACLDVDSPDAYKSLRDEFAKATAEIHASEQLEVRGRNFPLPDAVRVRDRFAMLVVRVWDSDGDPVEDFDIIFTASSEGDPNDLPTGFLKDRQRNPRSRNTVTFYLNETLVRAAPAIYHGDDMVRPSSGGVGRLGMRVVARPESGLAHYGTAEIEMSHTDLANYVRADQTTVVDVHLCRIVRSDTTRLLDGDDPASQPFDITRYDDGSDPI
jgi:hypothetical protein